ncbi:hypothetical protein SKAU_G00380870 [Synaphobranchus kaupii]|uniref:Uncharacterized protein n=1 Tax=Synaphobranchus kaupii TaxID=118154 RepID=A0A9Q1EDP0_SYNKA|nr:hypothetical protein SKAU_G00380870 [Synaphobranchus kaupii]
MVWAKVPFSRRDLVYEERDRAPKELRRGRGTHNAVLCPRLFVGRTKSESRRAGLGRGLVARRADKTEKIAGKSVAMKRNQFDTANARSHSPPLSLGRVIPLGRRAQRHTAPSSVRGRARRPLTPNPPFPSAPARSVEQKRVHTVHATLKCTAGIAVAAPLNVIIRSSPRPDTHRMKPGQKLAGVFVVAHNARRIVDVKSEIVRVSWEGRCRGQPIVLDHPDWCQRGVATCQSD